MARISTGGAGVYLIDRNMDLSAPAIVTQEDRLALSALREIITMHHVKEHPRENVSAQDNSCEDSL